MKSRLGYAATFAAVLLWWSATGLTVGHLEQEGAPLVVQLLAMVTLAFVAPIGAGLLWAYAGARRDEARGRSLIDQTPRLVGRMRRSTAPTLLLTPAKSPGFSKLGGLPELPAGLSWPQGAKGPRTFVAQLDLAVAAASGAFDWLPSEGRIYLFVDDLRTGFADYGLTLSTAETEVVQATPVGKPSEQFRERRVAFLQMESTPSLDWLDVDLAEINLSDEGLEHLADLPNEAFGDEIQHRIGGYPSEIQSGQMQIECELLRRGLKNATQGEVSDAVRRASKQWRMLMQIDADPSLGMRWGDAGRLYVFVRKSDAMRGDFSRTITLAQTH